MTCKYVCTYMCECMCFSANKTLLIQSFETFYRNLAQLQHFSEDILVLRNNGIYLQRFTRFLTHTYT